MNQEAFVVEQRKKSKRRGPTGTRGLTAYINGSLYDDANALRVRRRMTWGSLLEEALRQVVRA